MQHLACAGVYSGTKRRWRVKSKHLLVSMQAFDMDGDGVLEVVSGWANGKVRETMAIICMFKHGLVA
jgi:hypothetical protein